MTGCAVVLPPQNSQSPVVTQTTNTLVASLGTQTSASSAQPTAVVARSNATSTTSGSDTKSADSDSSDKSAKKAESAEIKTGDTKNATASKLYCN